ncbi:MAG: spinster family MFS transporter [Alphaproteobacteria bacterium]
MANIDDKIPAPMITPEHAPAVQYSKSYVRYVIGILTVVYIFNFMDRQILSILMQPIKEEMQLSDTQLGFLSGVAFALFYATLGIPIARLADQYSRVNLITICLSIWSFMTVLSGMAANFWQLLAARIGVGIGEAGGSPSSHSLIADYVPVQNRATALGVFALGVPIGLMVGFQVGGWLDQNYGWRTAFLVAGVPGLLLAVILRLTVREPKRGHSQTQAQIVHVDQPSIKQVAQHMRSIRTFRLLCIACALQAFAGYGLIQWLPSFLSRSHQMSSGDIGFWLAMTIGVGGAIGSIGGGYFADRFSRRNIGWQLWLPAIGSLLGALLSFGVLLSDLQASVMVFVLLQSIAVNAYLGPGFAVTQTLSPVRMRAIASALLLFAINIIGLGLGPQVVGILSDQLNPAFGDDALRYAILGVCMAYFGAAAFFMVAGRAVRDDFSRAAVLEAA